MRNIVCLQYGKLCSKNICVFLLILHTNHFSYIQYNEAYCIVINTTNAFLVDRQKTKIVHAGKTRDFPEFHLALALLVVYARKNKLMESMATVAINALKLASIVSSGT